MSSQAVIQEQKTTPLSSDDTPSVCAVVVAYIPDTFFKDRLCAILPQVDALVVVDNTPAGAVAWTSELPEDDIARIHLIENRANLGIAAALNQGLAYAVSNGYPWVLTLDQDTQCYPDMVDTLLQVASGCKSQPAIIGGNYFDTKRGRHEITARANHDCVESKTVITSGCLVDSTFLQSLGGFREDYFIDQVDHEICLRVRAYGRPVVITRKPIMAHSVGGQLGPKVPLLGWMLPDHSPLRKYYITRNSVVTVRTYWKNEPVWCLVRLSRLLLGLPSMVILEQDKWKKIHAFIAGFRDGVKTRMGPCRHSWLNRA